MLCCEHLMPPQHIPVVISGGFSVVSLMLDRYSLFSTRVTSLQHGVMFLVDGFVG